MQAQERTSIMPLSDGNVSYGAERCVFGASRMQVRKSYWFTFGKLFSRSARQKFPILDDKKGLRLRKRLPLSYIYIPITVTGKSTKFVKAGASPFFGKLLVNWFTFGKPVFGKGVLVDEKAC